MAVEYIPHLQPLTTTDTNLDMWLLDQAKFKKVADTITPNMVQADYVYVDGLPTYRILLRVTTQLDKVVNPANLVLMRRTTLKLSVPVVRQDESGATPEVEWARMEFWQGYAVPANEVISVNSVATFLTVNTGLFFPSYTGGVPSTASLTALGFRRAAFLPG